MIASEQLRIFFNSENRGFGAANNQAFALTDSPFVFLLNLDTEVPPGTIDTLIQKLKSDPKIGACGPKMLNADGSSQMSVFFNPPLRLAHNPFATVALSFAAAANER